MEKTVELKKQWKKDYAFDEAIKTLRTNIQFSGNQLKIIMLTSTHAGEGKSYITFETARSISQMGKKVLLIDADIRKSLLVSRYQVDKEVDGLSQYLSGQKELEDVLYKTNIENFDIIFSGPYAPNPAELLEEALFGEMLKKLKEKYEYILIDTPPLGSVIDSAVIAKHCDGAILVVEGGAISYRMAQKAKIQLEKSGCRILGAVLNKMDLSKGSYYSAYYSSHYGKYYRTYYGKNEK